VGDRILDLGCGSGDFTRMVAALVPDGHVLGLDAQPSMIDEARACAGPNQSFVVAPVQALGEVFGSEHDGTFDAVMSRSALHWVPEADILEVYRQARRLVRPGGWLRIECGGGGNVPTVVRVLDELAEPYGGPSCPWRVADAGSSLELLERAGFELGVDGFVDTIAQHRAFTRESMHGWLHSQCLNAYTASMPVEHHERFVADVDADLERFARHDGSYDQTYVRLDLLVRAPA
jgi:ubiquinone/menaquinone biosynthesis C-methylase UbiE